MTSRQVDKVTYSSQPVQCVCVCAGRVSVLIATDVASRGLDIKNIT